MVCSFSSGSKILSKSSKFNSWGAHFYFLSYPFCSCKWNYDKEHCRHFVPTSHTIVVLLMQSLPGPQKNQNLFATIPTCSDKSASKIFFQLDFTLTVNFYSNTRIFNSRYYFLQTGLTCERNQKKQTSILYQTSDLTSILCVKLVLFEHSLWRIESRKSVLW